MYLNLSGVHGQGTVSEVPQTNDCFLGFILVGGRGGGGGLENGCPGHCPPCPHACVALVFKYPS